MMKRGMLFRATGLGGVMLMLAGPVPAQKPWQSGVGLEKEFAVKSGGSLTIDVPEGDVVLRPSASEKVKVEVRIGAKSLERVRQLFDSMNFSVDGADSNIVITAGEPTAAWAWSQDGEYHIEIVVKLPATFDVLVKVETGDINLGNIKGQVDLSTGDGDISVAEVEGGPISLASTDGDIEALRLGSDVGIAVRSEDGDVGVDSLYGNLAAATTSGDIQVKVSGFAGLEAESGGGDITIHLAPDTHARVDLSGGEVRMDRSGGFEGKLDESAALGDLNGGGALLRAHSSSDGTVVLRLGTGSASGATN